MFKCFVQLLWNFLFLLFLSFFLSFFFLSFFLSTLYLPYILFTCLLLHISTHKRLLYPGEFKLKRGKRFSFCRQRGKVKFLWLCIGGGKIVIKYLWGWSIFVSPTLNPQYTFWGQFLNRALAHSGSEHQNVISINILSFWVRVSHWYAIWLRS